MVVSGVSQAVGNVISSFSGNHSLTAQRHAAEKLAERQAEINYDTWMKQNEYNTPEKQRLRLEQAGMNPLFYGLDGNSAGELQPANLSEANAAMAQQQSNAETRRATIMNAINAGVQNSIQAFVAESQANKNNSEANLADEQAKLTQVNTESTEKALPGIEHDVASKKYDSIFKQIQAQLAMNQFNNPEIRKSLEQMPKYEADKLLKDIALRDAEIVLREAETNLTSQRIRESIAECGLKGALAEQAYRAADELEALEKKYKAETISENEFRDSRKKLILKQIDLVGKQAKYYRIEQQFDLYGTLIGGASQSVGRAMRFAK